MPRKKRETARFVQVLEYFDGPQAVLLEKSATRGLLASPLIKRDITIHSSVQTFHTNNGSATAEDMLIFARCLCSHVGGNGTFSILLG